MPKLNVEVFESARLADHEHAERAELAELLRHVVQELGNGVSESGTLKDRAGAVVGAWNYKRHR